MTPALESPMTQKSPSSPPKRSRRMLPIVPAIPRSLEKRPKQEIKPTLTEQTGAASAIRQNNDGAHEDKTPSLAKAEIEDLDTCETKETIDEPLQVPIEDGRSGKPTFRSAGLTLVSMTDFVADDEPSPNDPQEIKHGGTAVDLSTSAQIEPSPVVPLSPDRHKLEAQSDVVRDSLPEPTASDEAIIFQQPPKPNNHPLRATASVFHAHPSPPNDVIASLTATLLQKEIDLAPSESKSIQPTPAAEATASPREPAIHGYGHAHNISFYPPPLSSNDPSSPARSFYQGYAYNPDSGLAGYSSHAHSSSQYSQQYQPQLEAYVSPGRQYAPKSPYYSSMPPFSTLGSQAPLTPSATPLDAMPEPWKMPNGITDGAVERGSYTGFQPYYRSDSHSTLRSDNILSGDADAINRRSQPLPNGIHELEESCTAEVAIYGGQAQRLPNEALLAKHLLHHFDIPDLADCELVVTHSEDRFTQTQWSLSSILIIQSRKLRDLFNLSKPAEAPRAGKKMLKLHLSDRFVTPAAMDAALRVLYGKPADTFVAMIPDEPDQTEPGLSAISMRASLAYAASGCLLHLQNVALRGLHVASEILNWENLEAALSFALESGLEREWSASSGVIPAYSSSTSRDSDPSPSSRVIFTPSSSSDQTGQKPGQPSATASAPETETRPPPQSAYELLLHCLDFIVQNFPTSWELDLSARPLADVDRLPVTAESRSPLSKSRLSRIQFGDHPSEIAAKSKDRNVLMSTILLSIPFTRLDYLLASVGEPLAHHMGSIIKERERRRQIVLQSKSVPWSERMAARGQEWAEAGYEESVDTSDDGMIKISRRYTGIAQDPTDEIMTDR